MEKEAKDTLNKHKKPYDQPPGTPSFGNDDFQKQEPRPQKQEELNTFSTKIRDMFNKTQNNISNPLMGGKDEDGEEKGNKEINDVKNKRYKTKNDDYEYEDEYEKKMFGKKNHLYTDDFAGNFATFQAIQNDERMSLLHNQLLQTITEFKTKTLEGINTEDGKDSQKENVEKANKELNKIKQIVKPFTGGINTSVQNFWHVILQKTDEKGTMAISSYYSDIHEKDGAFDKLLKFFNDTKTNNPTLDKDNAKIFGLINNTINKMNTYRYCCDLFDADTDIEKLQNIYTNNVLTENNLGILTKIFYAIRDFFTGKNYYQDCKELQNLIEECINISKNYDNLSKEEQIDERLRLAQRCSRCIHLIENVDADEKDKKIMLNFIKTIKENSVSRIDVKSIMENTIKTFGIEPLINELKQNITAQKKNKKILASILSEKLHKNTTQCEKIIDGLIKQEKFDLSKVKSIPKNTESQNFLKGAFAPTLEDIDKDNKKSTELNETKIEGYKKISKADKLHSKEGVIKTKINELKEKALSIINQMNSYLLQYNHNEQNVGFKPMLSNQAQAILESQIALIDDTLRNFIAEKLKCEFKDSELNVFSGEQSPIGASKKEKEKKKNDNIKDEKDSNDKLIKKLKSIKEKQFCEDKKKGEVEAKVKQGNVQKASDIDSICDDIENITKSKYDIYDELITIYNKFHAQLENIKRFYKNNITDDNEPSLPQRSLMGYKLKEKEIDNQNRFNKKEFFDLARIMNNKEGRKGPYDG